MTFADVFWFLFSSAGIASALGVAGVWLLARPHSRRARLFLSLIAVGYLAASIYSIPFAVNRMLSAGFRPLAPEDVPPGRSVVVLLGSGSRTRRDWSDRTYSFLDAIGAERTLESARIYSLVQPDWIISSGGPQDPEDSDAPSGLTMKTALVELGVPADRIIVEQESRNTREEAVIVARMLPALKVEHVILVTSAVHMRRSVGVFRAAGLPVIPAIAREPVYSDWTLSLLPTETGLRQSALVVHEIAGLVYYRIRGWHK